MIVSIVQITTMTYTPIKLQAKIHSAGPKTLMLPNNQCCANGPNVLTEG